MSVRQSRMMIAMLNALLVTVAALALGMLVSVGAWQVSRALPAYLALVVGLNFVQILTPTRALSPTGFVVQELLAALLRYWVMMELLARVFGRLPGALRVAREVVLGVLLTTAGLLAWGLVEAHGPRATFRALAVASAGAGLCFLALRCLTLHFYLPVHPLQRLAMTWFGAYLVLRSLLLGAATEWSAHARMQAATLSSTAWMAWAAALAWAAWAARRWSLPDGIAR